MKKLVSFITIFAILSAMLSFSITQAADTDEKILIAYFSRMENSVGDTSDMDADATTSASLGYDVAWNGDTQTVTITKAADISEPTTESTTEPTQTPLAEPTTEPSTAPSDNETEENKMLVVYFSGTGTTRALAETIAETAGADIFEIVPSEPYTSEDLNYNNDNCRANLEMNDESARPAIANSIESYMITIMS